MWMCKNWNIVGCKWRIFKSENQLFDEAGKIENFPTIIVQGRYDVVCPMKYAWDFHKKFKKED